MQAAVTTTAVCRAITAVASSRAVSHRSASCSGRPASFNKVCRTDGRHSRRKCARKQEQWRVSALALENQEEDDEDDLAEAEEDDEDIDLWEDELLTLSDIKSGFYSYWQDIYSSGKPHYLLSALFAVLPCCVVQECMLCLVLSPLTQQELKAPG